MHLHKTQSYFRKIFTTITVVAVGFLIITLSTLAYYMVVPLGKRAAGDLANVITHAAETWQAIPAADRPRFAQRMWSRHELVMATSDTTLPESTSLLPYLHFLEASLQTALGPEIRLKQTKTAQGENWFWVDVPLADASIRFGFPRSRIGVNPPIAFFVVLITGAFMTFITAALLSRRLSVPIERLYLAAQAVGKGHWPDLIEEDGPEELMVLTREFNRMNVQVRELLSNRTTLLAGIAHDLRTPLTQIQLALSMLPNNGGDEVLMRSIQEDLEVINRLIGQAVSISLELEEEERISTDIGTELEMLLDSIQTNGVEIQWSRTESIRQTLRPLALRRILTNLIVNAIRYGEGRPVTIACKREDGEMVVRIMDRGPGIPEEQREAVFRPFYRLEQSRGSETGGSGLGLAIVRQLADANKWKVEILPRPDGGTIVALGIPIYL